MKIGLKILKWIGLSIGAMLMLIVLTGLLLRVFGPAPKPGGELVNVDGFELHINCTGEKNNRPTLVIEAGAGVPSEYYHWLSEGLKDSMRVVRYDRAGIGYSDLSYTPRDPETVARELHNLLTAAGESPPYILAGHSLGGHFIRVFTQLYPDEVAALVFLDASHPEQRERLKLPERSTNNLLLNGMVVLGDLGILNLIDRMIGPLLAGEGLPEEINKQFHDFTADGKFIRGVIEEFEWIEKSSARAKEASDFGKLPIRVFSAAEANEGALRARGIDPVWHHEEWIKLQQEMANLSTNGKQITMPGNHVTIFTKKENAQLICAEIRALAKEE